MVFAQRSKRAPCSRGIATPGARGESYFWRAMISVLILV